MEDPEVVLRWGRERRGLRVEPHTGMGQGLRRVGTLLVVGYWLVVVVEVYCLALQAVPPVPGDQTPCSVQVGFAM